MLKLFALLAATALTPPPEDTARMMRAAIWHDLELNALIGNGNWVASLWANASRAEGDLHIQGLACRPKAREYRCAFVLFRDGGAAEAFGRDAPARLSCEATLERDGEEGLSVKHLPPRGGGHSRTTMRCQKVPA